MVDKLGRNKLFGQDNVAMETEMFTSLFLKALLPCQTFLHLTFFQAFYLRKIKKSFYYWDLKCDGDNLPSSFLRSKKITCPAHCPIARKYNLIGLAKEKKKKAVCSCLIWICFHSGAMGRSRDLLLEAIFVPEPRADKDDFLSTSLKPSWNVSLAQSYLNPKVSVVWERENGVFVEFTNKSEVSELSLETFGSKLCKFYLFYSSGNINLTQPPTCLVSWDLMRLNWLLHCESYLHSSVCAFAPLTFCPHTWWQFSVRNDFFPYLGLPWLSFNTDRRPDSEEVSPSLNKSPW